MLGHREVVIRPYGSDFISVYAEAVEIDAKSLGIAADIDYLVNAVSAKHCDCFIMYSYAGRINDYYIRLLRDLVKLFFYITADVMTICDAIQFGI